MSKVLPSEVRDDKQKTCVEEAEENVAGQWSSTCLAEVSRT